MRHSAKFEVVSTLPLSTRFGRALGSDGISPLARPRRRCQGQASGTILRCLIILLAGITGHASEDTALEKPSLAVDLARLSLEDLGQIKVTSVSRKSESLSSAAAPIHVITQDDLRRSGVTSLAEALRMAPGMQVARANARQWGISARGFNESHSNKLLVLMDGRSIYTPLFSGVFWEEADTLLEDIDRIEVIRGPGATLWGANAVNGVVNIITKSAKETQGTLLSGGRGTITGSVPLTASAKLASPPTPGASR